MVERGGSRYQFRTHLLWWWSPWYPSQIDTERCVRAFMFTTIRAIGPVLCVGGKRQGRKGGEFRGTGNNTGRGIYM